MKNKQIIKNINTIIAILKRTKNKNFDMDSFQGDPLAPGYVTTEKELHACGNTACVGGTVAVTKEWRNAGGTVSTSGVPMFERAYAADAIQKWSGLSAKETDKLIHGDLDYDTLEQDSPWSKYYGRVWSQVKPKHAIKKLKKLRKKYEAKV